MSLLLPPLRNPPISFAHRGARAHAPENTLEAFELALRLGATGLESDVWLTADGIPVLDHDGKVGPFLRRRPIGQVARADLPAHIPELAELFASFGTDFELSLDLKDGEAGRRAVEVAMAADVTMPDRLWLCSGALSRLTPCREAAPHVKLVKSTRLAAMKQGPERMGAELQAEEIDAINLHHSDWSGGLVTLFHRFRVLTFGWDAQQARMLDGLLGMGIDGFYSDHTDRMVDALARDAERRAARDAQT
ncbi:MAG: glycerophosphodiester phosphodiesterase [Aquihabitans sp.]